MAHSNSLHAIEKSPVYKAALNSAQYLYSILAELPADERYATIYKLRNKANDLLYYTALALGNNHVTNSEFEWASVKKEAVAALTMYDFAVSQEYIKSNNLFRKNISFLITEADKQFEISEKASNKIKQEEMESWQARYEKWKEMRIYES